ncbi:MAG: daunorubicin C-13 ketoreductase [Bacteroidetes bacterium SW_9_63_38]|nr:MAG: daunorubicin C-13 ketoreductase [Bacteroidetes bacterium SW_9_63_38]
MSARPEVLARVTDADCTGKTALVTGSTNGIGRLAALALGRLGATVIVHGRDDAAGRAVVAELDEMGADATLISADFTDPDAVRRLAETVRDRTDGLDLLLNNAGGLFSEGRLVGVGVEQTFHVNHLAPYLLTAELLNHLRPGGRVVTTASEAHRGATLALDAVQEVDDYSSMGAYSRSKLANILFAAELARRLEARGRDITSSSVHPGFIPGSQFWRFMPGPLASLFGLIGWMPGTASVADGAAALLYAAVSDGAEATGRYFSRQQPTTPSTAAQDPDAANRLWGRSAELLGMEVPLPLDSADTGTTPAN